MTDLLQLENALESIATRYAAQDPEPKSLLESLQDILARIKLGKAIDPEENVPGQIWLTEGGLSKYRDLEKAYSEFALFVASGGDTQYQKMMQSLDDILK